MKLSLVPRLNEWVPYTENEAYLLSSGGLGKICNNWLFAQKIRYSWRLHVCTHAHIYREVLWEKKMKENIFPARLIDYKMNFIWEQSLVLNDSVIWLEGNWYCTQNNHAAEVSEAHRRPDCVLAVTNSRQAGLTIHHRLPFQENWKSHTVWWC